MTYSKWLIFRLFRLLFLMMALLAVTMSSYGQETSGRGRIYIPGDSISTRLSGLTLQVLFKGVADMYYYTDGEKAYYLVTDKNGRLYTINTAPEPKMAGKNDAGLKNEGMITVLKLVMADAPSLAGRIETLKPVRQSMTALMHEYHVIVTGSEDGITYELLPPALMPRFGINAGYAADILKADNTGELGSFRIDPAFYPFVGVTMISPLPRMSENLNISLDFSAAKRYVYGYYSNVTGAPENSGTYYELQMHQLLLLSDLMLGYSFGHGRWRPSLAGGFSSRAILHDKSRIDSDVAYDGLVISESDTYLTDKKIIAGFKVNGGMTYDLGSSMVLTVALNYTQYFGDHTFRTNSSAGLTAGLIF
jgi:opacity protein-like surface antigen